MTILEVMPVVVEETETTEEPEVWHRLCCVDRSKIVCGEKRKSTEMVLMEDDQDHTDCIICDGIWDTSRACPCPAIERCPNPTRNRGL